MLFYIRGSKFVKIIVLDGLFIYKGYIIMCSVIVFNYGYLDKLINSKDFCCLV